MFNQIRIGNQAISALAGPRQISINVQSTPNNRTVIVSQEGATCLKVDLLKIMFEKLRDGQGSIPCKEVLLTLDVSRIECNPLYIAGTRRYIYIYIAAELHTTTCSHNEACAPKMEGFSALPTR